jgi:hypothetical protein
MSKQNCWEYKKCERQFGGAKVSEFGVCPVSLCKCVNGENSGVNGGRVCWLVSKTLCSGVQGNHLIKMKDCYKCPFFRKILMEEGYDIADSKEIIKTLKENGF